MIATSTAPIEATLAEYGHTPESHEILSALQFLTSDPAHMELGVVPTEAVKSVLDTINRTVSESTTVVDTRNSPYIGHRGGPAGCVYHGTVALRSRLDMTQEFVTYDSLMRALGVGSITDDLITGYHFENRINASPAFSPMYWFLTAVSMYEDARCGNISCYSEYTETHTPFVVILDNTETSDPGARIISIDIETGEADWVKPGEDELDPADYDFDFESDDEVADDAGKQLSFDEWLDEEEDYGTPSEDERCTTCGSFVRCDDGETGVTIGDSFGHVDCMIGSKK